MLKKIKSRSKRFLVQLPRLSRALSGGSLTKCISLHLKLAFFAVTRQSLLKGKKMRFSFIYNQTDFTLDMFDNMDVTVLVEIFVLKEYKWDEPGVPKTILDLGAHWGDTALFYSLEYPDAHIFSVEPIPEMFNRLQDVTSGLNNVTTIQGALSEDLNPVKLFLFDTFLGSSTKKRKEGGVPEVMVPGLTLDQIISNTGVSKFDLVKFDIEGAEEVLFKCSDLKAFGKAYIGEIHLDLISVSIDDIKTIFKEFDTTFESIGGQRYILKAM